LFTGTLGFLSVRWRFENMRPTVGCALLLSALASVACRTMKPVTLDQLHRLGSDRVWVTESDQAVVLMYEPQVVGDTLVGYIGRGRGRLPSAGIKQLRVRVPAPARTALLAVGSTAALVGLAVAVAGNGQSQIITVTAGAPGDCDKHPDQPGCNGN
jgi:hypothetical protein